MQKNVCVWGVGIVLSKSVHVHGLLVLGIGTKYSYVGLVHRERTSLVPRYARPSVPFREWVIIVYARPGRKLRAFAGVGNYGVPGPTHLKIVRLGIQIQFG